MSENKCGSSILSDYIIGLLISRLRKNFPTVATIVVASTETKCVTADRVRPNKFPIYRAIKKKCDMSSLGHRTIPRIFLRAANLPAVILRLWRRTSVFLQQNLQMTKERPRKRQQQRKRPRLGRFLAFSRYKFL